MYQVKQVNPTRYRLEGSGPMGFAVRGLNSIPSHTPAEFIGMLARAKEWAKLSEAAVITRCSPRELIARFGQGGHTLARDLWVLQPDTEPDAIGGHLMIRDLWHRGHRLRYLDADAAYVPYEWAEAVIKEILEPTTEMVPGQP